MSADQIFTVTRSTDPRLKQGSHSFNAALGASAITQVITKCQQPSTSTLSISVIPSSPQTVIQRAPIFDATLNVSLTFNLIQAQTIDAPLVVWGRDFALARAAPLGQLVSSWNITINNAAVQQQNIPLPDLLHFLEGAKGRTGHGTTFRTPVYANWDDAFGTTYGLGSVADMQDGDIGPGGFDFVFTAPNGTPLSGSSTYTDDLGNTIKYVNGIPVVTAALNPAGPGVVGADFNVYILIKLRDTIMCSPFGFSYEQSLRETGLHGISSMLFQATLTTPAAARLFQGAMSAGVRLKSQQWPPNATKGGIPEANITTMYLSPSVQSQLPERSIVSLCNLQYYQTTTDIGSFCTAVPPYDGAPLSTGVVTFPAVSFSNVPDMLIISVRPQIPSTSQDPFYFTNADYQCTWGDNAIQQFVFANQRGLFAGQTSLTLACMSRNNGCKASLAQYGGANGTGYFISNGRRTVAGGAPLAIRPGIDFPLPPGVSVGSTGQVQFNFQMQVNVPQPNLPYVCTVIAVSSGYFVTENGVSRQVLVGLDQATVLGAQEGPDRYLTSKLIGGGWLSSLSSYAKNALENKDKLSALASAAYGAYKDKDPMAALGVAHQGYKMMRGSGGAMAGSGVAGAGMKRMRDTSLAARLAAQ